MRVPVTPLPPGWENPQRSWISDAGASAGAVRFWIRGVPKSFANDHRFWRVTRHEMRQWTELTFFAAAASRVSAPDESMRIVPSRKLGERRRVRMTAYRTRLLDPDNLRGSLKPVLDGLKGQLIVDDSAEWIELQEDQERVRHRSEERVEIEVSLP